MSSAIQCSKTRADRLPVTFSQHFFVDFSWGTTLTKCETWRRYLNVCLCALPAWCILLATAYTVCKQSRQWDVSVIYSTQRMGKFWFCTALETVIRDEGHTRDNTSTITALSDNCSLCYGCRHLLGKTLTERERWTPDGGKRGETAGEGVNKYDNEQGWVWQSWQINTLFI